MCPSISEILLVADALVREAVERELVIGFPAVGVAGRVERGLASGGAAPADWPLVAIGRSTMEAQVLGDPRRRDAEPDQTGYLAYAPVGQR